MMLWTRWMQFWQTWRNFSMKAWKISLCVKKGIKKLCVFPKKISKTFFWTRGLQFWQTWRNLQARNAKFFRWKSQLFFSKMNSFSSKSSSRNVLTLPKTFAEIPKKEESHFLENMCFSSTCFSVHVECTFANIGSISSLKIGKWFKNCILFKNLFFFRKVPLDT